MSKPKFCIGIGGRLGNKGEKIRTIYLADDYANGFCKLIEIYFFGVWLAPKAWFLQVLERRGDRS